MSVAAAVRQRVRVQMRPESGKDCGGTGLPGGEGGPGRMSDRGGISSLSIARREKRMLVDNRRGSEGFCRARAAGSPKPSL